MTEKEWKQIDEIVDRLGCSIDEAKQMLLDDKAIDKGEKLFSLSADLEAGAKKARQADRKKGGAVNRKEDTDKTALMALLMGSVEECDPTKTKPGEFEFLYNGRKFKVVLSAPRS